MPRELEKKLEAEADKRGLTGKRRNAYIYGTMQNVTSWKPGQKDKAKKIADKIIKG